MTQDDLYQVQYKCSECGKSLAIDDYTLRAIADEFARLGWLNVPVEVEGDRTDYIVTCPKCAARDEALELDRQQQADSDYFLAETGRW